MGILMGILMVVFILVCLLMTAIILLQSSKGDSLASGIFGGAGMQNLFGGRGAATFLSKLTTGLAVSFIVLSLFLARFYGSTGSAPKLEKSESKETQIIERPEEPSELAVDEAAPAEDDTDVVDESAPTNTDTKAEQTTSEESK